MFGCGGNTQKPSQLTSFGFIFQIRSADDTDSVQELERDAWQREKNILQNALKQAESKLAKATVEIENKLVVEASSPKVK